VKSFKRSDYSTLVHLFLKEPTKINYAREYGIAKKLLSTYGDFTFWKSTLLDPKRSILNSLAYFLTEDGKYFLKYNYSIHKKREKLSLVSLESKKIPLKEEKVGEDLSPKIKSKLSLMDFIKNDT
jgi:hypothetical protein